MKALRLPLLLAALLWAGPALAWPYEVYPTPKDLSGYKVASAVELPEGKAELLLDKRITPENTAKVRTVLLGGHCGDDALQTALERDDPLWALVRFTPKESGATPEIVVLDHAIASLKGSDIEGNGHAKLEVQIDYLQPHRGLLTLFMQPVAGKLKPVEYADADSGYKVQIELTQANKAWWKRQPSGGAEEFLLVDGRFPDRTDLMRIHWNGQRWLRYSKMLPPGAVADVKAFPPASAFP